MTDEARPRPRHAAAIDVDAFDLGATGEDGGSDDLDVRLQWPADDEGEPSWPSLPREAVTPGTTLEPAPGDLTASGPQRDVPLLPLVIGRVEAVDGQMRTLGMRLDVLASSIGAIRSSIGDRIESYAEMTSASGRHADQVVEDFRRSQERALRELRTGLAATDERVRSVADRVAALATDVATLVERVSGGLGASDGDAEAASTADAVAALETTVGALDEQFTAAADVLARVDEVVTDFAARDTATATDLLRVSNALADLVAIVDAGRPSDRALGAVVDDVLEALQGVGETLRDVRTLVEVVVDTMPSSAEGSGVDDAERIAEAVVARLDLDELARRVARCLEETLEVVADPPP